jgi:hypothetical protein
MARILSVLALFFLATAPAAAQDMPLSQILIDGEGWKDVSPGFIPPQRPLGANFSYIAFSPDRGTVYLCSPKANFIEATRSDGRSVPPNQGIPYCPLRVKRGEKTIKVAGLAIDRDGRIYASTEIGVQVFDPTGRLCGVLTPAASGPLTPDEFAFEGDKLTLWINGRKYARKLRTEGAK